MLDDFKAIAFKVIIGLAVVFIIARYGASLGQLLHEFVQGLRDMAAGAQSG